MISASYLATSLDQKEMNDEPNKMIRLLAAMKRIRMVEEAIVDVYPAGVIRTPTHLSIGQEGVAVGVCDGLTVDDQLFSSHRCHAHYLAKGGDLKKFVAELYGREGGCSRGRGGSVHLVDTAVGMMGSSAILGGIIAVAMGAAYVFKYDGSGRISVVFHGDAVMEEGIIWECFSVALRLNLPILFVCENNQYSTNIHISRRQPDLPIVDRVKGVGIMAHAVDGNVVLEVQAVAQEMVASCRSGDGPGFIEAHTYRIREHVGPLFDHDRGFRPGEEVRQWQERCPIKHLEEHLIREGLLDQCAIDRMTREITAEIAHAFEFAEKSPWPAPDSILENTV